MVGEPNNRVNKYLHGALNLGPRHSVEQVCDGIAGIVHENFNRPAKTFAGCNKPLCPERLRQVLDDNVGAHAVPLRKLICAALQNVGSPSDKDNVKSIACEELSKARSDAGA